MVILIFLTIGMYIKPTRFLEFSPSNIKYDLKKRLREGCTDASKIMIMKLKKLWLQTTTRIIMKRILKKKINN